MLHPKQFGEQLRMFMTADEIKDYATPVDIDRYGGDTREESEGMLWRHKRQTADASGFTQQIGREGVKRPVEIMHGRQWPTDPESPHGRWLVNGAHRVAAELGTGRYLPVMHHGTRESYEQESDRRFREGDVDINWSHLEEED